MEADYPEEFAALRTPMHLVTDSLYLGNIRAAQDEQQLKAHNITCIVQCLQNQTMAPAFPFAEYCSVPIADLAGENITAFLPRAIRFIHTCRQAGKTVLVHCEVGASRSATVVIAYLMATSQMSWEEALNFVRSRRRCVYPNPGFLRQLQELNLDDIRQELV